MANLLTGITQGKAIHKSFRVIFDGKFTEWHYWQRNYCQHGVLCKLGVTSKHQPIANTSCGSGWTNNFQL
jgi:hypothetical protein